MCGIAGIWRKNKIEELESDIKKMTDSIIHRGPDGEGHWIDPKNGIALGHRRLAILDLTEGGFQPMQLQDRYVITFNGEIYNYVELREKLIFEGFQFKSDSDTEVLITAYHHWGIDFLQQLDGMFSFAIYDKSKNELFCARDRFGEKPFYYTSDNFEFSFGSEMKEFFAKGFPKSFNQKSVFLYLNYDVVENPNDKTETFYTGISQLPASHYLIVKSDLSVTLKRYWSLSTFTNNDISFDDAKEKFKSLFQTSVARRLRSDVRVGSSLSGGVDSSSVLGMIHQLNPEINFNTYTARFNDSNYDEGEWIKILKNKYDFNAHFCYPSADQIIDDLDQIFYHQEEPFGSTSIIAQWEVMKLAKSDKTTVLLDGQGADEAFGGYFKHFNPFLTELYANDRKSFKKQLSAIEKHLELESFLSKKERIRLSAPKTFDRVADLTRKYRNNFSGDISQEMINSFKETPSPFHRQSNLKEFLSSELFDYGLGKLLRFSDRNAMAHSIEVRLPFLYHELVEFVFSLPSNYLINDGWTKNILRQSMTGIVPNEILFRKDKKGFQAPASWLQNPNVQEVIHTATSNLQKEGIISKPITSNSWKYIMLNKLMNE